MDVKRFITLIPSLNFFPWTTSKSFEPLSLLKCFRQVQYLRSLSLHFKFAKYKRSCLFCLSVFIKHKVFITLTASIATNWLKSCYYGKGLHKLKLFTKTFLSKTPENSYKSKTSCHTDTTNLRAVYSLLFFVKSICHSPSGALKELPSSPFKHTCRECKPKKGVNLGE